MPVHYINHLGQQVPVISSQMLADELIPAALDERTPLSVVRMSDGEEKIYSYCQQRTLGTPMEMFSREWRIKFGVNGISCGEMKSRLEEAAKTCTYFAPDGGEEFFLKHFPARYPFAEIYFPHKWSRKQRIAMLNRAGSVIVVNRDEAVAERIAKSPFNNATVHYVSLRDWRDATNAISDCRYYSTPLVFVSAGPASKFIIPAIAARGKVVLDMGSGAPHFWCVQGKPVCGDSKCRTVTKEE